MFLVKFHEADRRFDRLFLRFQLKLRIAADNLFLVSVQRLPLSEPSTPEPASSAGDRYFNVALKLTLRLTGSLSFAAASVDFAVPASVFPAGLSSLSAKMPAVPDGKSPA